VGFSIFENERLFYLLLRSHLWFPLMDLSNGWAQLCFCFV